MFFEAESVNSGVCRSAFVLRINVIYFSDFQIKLLVKYCCFMLLSVLLISHFSGQHVVPH